MFEDSALFLLWLLFAVVPFWVLPPRLAGWRQAWLIGWSVPLVFAIAPWACLFVLWMWLGVSAGTRLLARHRDPRALGLVLLAVCGPLLLQRTVLLEVGLAVTLGVAFATLRAAAMTIDGYVKRAVPETGAVGVCLFFLPLYTVGPIEAMRTFTREQLAGRLDLAFAARGPSRIALGLFKTVFIADVLVRGELQRRFAAPPRFDELGSAETALFVALSFLYTYVNFSGVADIAIGASRLFGLRVVENFDAPVLARDLRDFWKRWHISLGRWITQYLYFPVVANLRTAWSPYAATFVAFALVGWWHGSTLPHLAWGVLHGAGLCTVMAWQRFMRARHARLYEVLARNPAYLALAWLSTLGYVAWVQTFSNRESFADALSMTRALVGG